MVSYRVAGFRREPIRGRSQTCTAVHTQRPVAEMIPIKQKKRTNMLADGKGWFKRGDNRGVGKP